MTSERKPPRPSGPTQTKAQRRASGRARIDVWVHDETEKLLGSLALRLGRTRASLVEQAIEDLGHALEAGEEPGA